MNNKEKIINAKIGSNKTSYKYFQPIITNNTQTVSAKSDNKENNEEVFDEKKVYKFKVKLGDILKSNESENNEEKVVDLQNKVEEIKSALQEESKEQEDIAAKVEEIKDALQEEIKDQDKAENNVEDVEDASQEEVNEQDNKEEINNKLDEVNRELQEKEKIDEDLTSKMDLPLGVLKNNEESVPFRREAPDDIKEFKVKLFLLATNAKKPVRIMVNRKKFLIGSDFEQMDCVIRNNRYISRCHAKIHYDSDCYFIEDAGSMNGTYINGVKLAEGLKYKLMTGDIINLADCKFEVSMK